MSNLILKVTRKYKGSRMVKTILKRTESEGSHILTSKLTYRTQTKTDIGIRTEIQISGLELRVKKYANPYIHD